MGSFQWYERYIVPAKVLIHETKLFNRVELECYVISDLSAHFFQGLGVGGSAKLKALCQPLTQMLSEVNGQQYGFFGLAVP